MIQVDAPKEKLTVIPMGNSDDLEVGRKVLAIGNPFGLGQTLTTRIISSLGRQIRAEEGALIAQVVPGGPADRAGLRGGNRQVQVGNSLIPVGGDVITAMNRKDLTSSDELIRRIRDHLPGDKIELRILRDGQYLDVAVTLGERPQDR